MNVVSIIGRICTDPIVNETHDGTPVAGFRIAYNEPYGKKEASFFDVSAFGKKAEFVRNYLAKGKAVEIVGKLKQESYTNRDGVKVSRVRIVANEIGFAESKAAGTNGDATPKPVNALPTENDFAQIPEGFDEELPFN